ncbi:MAG: hypothetical protein IKA50_03465 [Clostridia bacterium]|nr:hypothetical protein [Clostridia bacterium]
MKNVKKLLALLLAMAMLFALCACGGDDNKKDDKKDDKKETQTTQSANADPSAAPSVAPSTAPSQNINNNKFPVGSWTFQGITLTLSHDGTGSLHDQAITWKSIDAQTLQLINGEGDVETLKFVLNGDTVSFTDEDGETTVWTKKSAANDTPVDEPDVDIEITYDAALLGTWYMDDAAMVLAANGAGEVYVGDSESAELEWATVDGVLVIAFGGEEYYALYEISGNTLTLTYEDGEVETWTK